MSHPNAEILLYRHAEAAWHGAIRPWLQAGAGLLQRACVVVPTRAQAHGWKQRCLLEGVPLLGVEFLSPGLARQKWLGAGLAGVASPVLGRELLLHGLRLKIEEALLALAAEAPERGILETLRSDTETALDDWDLLLKAGPGADGFDAPAVAQVFKALEAWIQAVGCETSVAQFRRALKAEPGAAKRFPGRLLVIGLSAENAGEFGNVAALTRCFDDATLLLPEPEFRGRSLLDERWVEVWENFLGCASTGVDHEEPAAHCGLVSDEWLHGKTDPAVPSVAALHVGRTRADEVELAARQVDAWLAEGADSIAVVLPGADACGLALARVLAQRGIAFHEHMDWPAAPSIEAAAQRALLGFLKSGGTWEAWFGCWDLLAKVRGIPKSVELRALVARLFDEKQSYLVKDYTALLAASETEVAASLREVLEFVPLEWPSSTTLASLVERLGHLFTALGLGEPAGWQPLVGIAARDVKEYPLAWLWPVVESFLPDQGTEKIPGGTKGFARVTLTTRKRAEALLWSHVLVMESNAGVWPRRPESSCWLPDGRRRELQKSLGSPLDLLTADDRQALEKLGWASLARNARNGFAFTAARLDESEPDEALAPNSWLERALWRDALARGREDSDNLERLFEERTRTFAPVTAPTADQQAWLEVWNGRRDPARPFDEHFFSVAPEAAPVDRIAARTLEAGFADPAVLWHRSVLAVERTPHEPLERTRKKWLGQQAHAVLAAALKTPPVEGRFGAAPAWDDVEVRIRLQVAALEGVFGANLYWKSCYAELLAVSLALLGRLRSLEPKPFLAVEWSLPRETKLLLGADGCEVGLRGRIDLVLSDRPEISGANVEIVDFKTGADGTLDAKRMSKGHSLQLGVYLSAVRGLGAVSARVTMIRPNDAIPSFVRHEELEEALAPLAQVGKHLTTGIYGALTKPATDHAPGGEPWPVACVPIAEKILKAKYEVSFGTADNGGGDHA